MTDQCYYFFDVKVVHEEAVGACKDLHQSANIPIIRGPEDQSFLTRKFFCLITYAHMGNASLHGMDFNLLSMVAEM